MAMEKAQRPVAAGYIHAEKAAPLFALCWFAYFAANLGRLSYTVSIAEILLAEGIEKGVGGLVGTGFFICYGAGQLVCGYLGDRLTPRRMELWGLILTGICNFLMAAVERPGQMMVIWAINGLVQSALWPPIIRIIAEYFPPRQQKKACVNMATTYPVATLLSYLAGAGLIGLAGWRSVFIACGVFLLLTALLWAVWFPVLDRYREEPESSESVNHPKSGSDLIAKTAFPVVAVAFFCLALVNQGALRDGLTTWVPPYLTDTFALGSSMAILTTSVLPVVNLLGVYVSNLVYRKLKSEGATCVGLFVAASFCALGLLLTGRSSLPLSLLFFSLVTACMMGINTMLIGFMPTYFARMRKVSLVSGLANSMVYVGSSISSFGIGVLADLMGWQAVLAGLVILAAGGAVFSGLAAPGWKRFVDEQQKAGG